MIWITQPHLWIAFFATIFLMIFHYLSPWFAKQLPREGKRFASFAGGVAVAYVFLHMLPGLVEYNKPIGNFLIKNQMLTQFSELMIYIVALFGFLIYYGLELTAEKYNKSTNCWVYNLHLCMFCLYNFLITYTMSLRVQDSITATILFTIAMALHFVLTDRKFERLYTSQFNHFGRFLLILALLSGWVCSVIFDPVNIMIAAFMLAFLAGSVLLTVFKEELPNGDLISYSWFVLGSSLIMIILVMQIFITSWEAQYRLDAKAYFAVVNRLVAISTLPST